MPTLDTNRKDKGNIGAIQVRQPLKGWNQGYFEMVGLAVRHQLQNSEYRPYTSGRIKLNEAPTIATAINSRVNS